MSRRRRRPPPPPPPPPRARARACEDKHVQCVHSTVRARTHYIALSALLVGGGYSVSLTVVPILATMD
ncbi:unnamed protein product [Penicillium bialowiezense]